jgi:hypothetical protein
MSDRESRRYQADLHLHKRTANLSLLLECKSSSDYVETSQLQRYLATTGQEVIQFTGLLSDDPRNHLLDVGFIGASDAAATLVERLTECPDVYCSGWGVVELSGDRLRIVHDELSDSDLSSEFQRGWVIDLESLALEWLPYEASCTQAQLGDALFQTLLRFFVNRKREFSIHDLGVESNQFWEYMEPQHQMLSGRIRKHMKSIRGTALKGWISRVNTGSVYEERWKFTRASTTRANVLRSFQRRHARYVELLEAKQEPQPRDFEGIDPEQLHLPFSPEGFEEGPAGEHEANEDSSRQRRRS